jgi:hypothetical protein
MQSKVFISAPISVDWSTVQRFEKEITKRNLKVSYWERWSKYSNSDLDSSDAVVFILPRNKFKATHNELPIGLKAELSRAYAASKKIYIGYETSTGSCNIYDTITDGKYIEGLTGTANDIYEDLDLLRSAKKIATNSLYGVHIHSSNPCAEIELPKGPTGFSGRPGIAGVDGIEFDERLLLM